MRPASDACSRREFCKKMSQAALAAGVMACGIGSCTNKYAENVNPVTLDLTQPAYQALQQTGGAAYADNQLIIVYRASPASINAFSSACTHQGCILPLPDANGTITCYCHGATFNTQGRVLGGPALTDLRSFYTVISGNMVTIYGNPPPPA